MRLINETHARRVSPRPTAGFTLVELAVVLLILGLLIGGLLIPLSAQIEQQRVTQAQKQLSEIREALIGYAILYGYLPCPTTTTDPNDANFGVADTSCSSPSAEGFLPWKTLGGLPEIDPWGIRRTAPSSPWIGYWRYRVDQNFANPSAPITLSTTAADGLEIRDAKGNRITTTGEPPVAIIYSTGKDTAPNGANGGAFDNIYQADVPNYETEPPGSYFDDIAIWISRPALMSRMIQAGKLP